MKKFIFKQFVDIKKGGISIFLKKVKATFKIIINIINPFYYIGLIILLVSYLIRPLFLIRWDNLHSEKIGHFAANTEIYCCKTDFNINVPQKKFIDLFCLGKKVCNKQLKKMWERELNVLPRFILQPIINLNNIICLIYSNATFHQIHINKKLFSIKNEKDFRRVSTDRDLFNLIPKTSPHINFTKEEVVLGEKYLKSLGLNENSKIVCLTIRDSAYEKKFYSKEGLDMNHNSYRNQNIFDYMLAAEELTKRGYWVFRMGKEVSTKLKSTNPKIIDYANLKSKNDFYDIFLAYKCKFCVRTAGYGAIPRIFRKPIVYIEVPLIDLQGQGNKNHDLLLSPYYYSKKKKKKLSISEIFKTGASDARTTEKYKSLGIEIEFNSPEEIKDVVIEMVERLEGVWKENPEDISLQKSFFKLFEKNLILHNKRKFMGEFRIKQSSKFLKNNGWWLQ